jgi:hypothetical protein
MAKPKPTSPLSHRIPVIAGFKESLYIIFEIMIESTDFSWEDALILWGKAHDEIQWVAPILRMLFLNIE